MNLKRLIGTSAAIVAVSTAVALYAVHPAKSSDHQDTFNLANQVGHNKSADITDVFVFPSPTNPANVVFAMDVSPLIPAGMGTSEFFDPTLMWQFKISHRSDYQEDQVIQVGVNGTGASQTFTLYGPAAPNEVGTANTFVASTGTFGYNNAATIGSGANAIQVFAGPRADPFYFDLFQFFKIFPDRNAGTHTSQSDVGTANMLGTSTPTFNGFAANTMSSSAAGAYACSTAPSVDALTDIQGGFNVLSYVIEVPKSMITTGFNSQTIHVWATVNSSTTNS